MLTHRLRTMGAAAAVLATIIALLAVAGYQGAAAQGQAPPAPQNPMAHLIAGPDQEPQVRVSWDALSEGTVTGHTVSRNDGESFAVPGGATTYGDRDIVPGASYTYTVTAENDEGSSPTSTPATAQVPPAPSAPGSLAGSVAEPQAADETATVTLTWLASTVPEAASCDTAYPLSGYTIVRSGGDQETELGTADAGATSFTDSAAAFSTDYTYRVTAQSAIGASPASETPVNVFSQPVLPPTGITASIADTFDGSISLSWTAPTEGADIVQYSVHRYLGPDPYEGTDIPVTLMATAPETSVVDDTAEAGVTYSYLVIAQSAFNISLPSVTTVIEAPAPASGLTATAAAGAIDLAWTAPAAGTPGAYRVERQPLNGEWTNIADTTATSHSDNTAQPNATHRYRVQHRNRHGGSTWAESSEVMLLAVPGKPAGLTATTGGNDNVLAWTAPDSPFIDGYRVRHRTGDADWRILAEEITGAGYTHRDAAADVTHHYAVQAYNQAGDGPWSATASTGRITPAGVPQSVSIRLDGQDIVMSWERPGTVHISAYTVRQQAGDAPYIESERLPEGQTSFRMTGVAGDTIYRVSVRAHNDAGDSPWSDELEIMRRLAPSTPTDASVSVGEADIVLSWSAPAIGAPDGYHVEYGELDSDERATEELPATQTSFTHSGNIEGVTYRYRVRAHNAAGESPWSETLTASRTLAPPAPTGLTTEVSGSLITLSWTAPTTGIVDSYEVEYGVLDSGETSTSTIDADGTGFEHIGALGDVTHRYRVRSVNSAGASPWAGPVEARWIMPPGVPTNVNADTDGDDILVSWNRPDSVFIDEYHVDQRQYDTQDWTRTVVAADQTSHRHAGPTPGTTYEYRVRTVNAGGVSEWSPTATGVRYNTAAPPAQFIYTPIGTDRILVKWTASPTPDIQRYQLRHNVDGGDWTEVNIPKRKPYHFAQWTTEQEYLEFQIRTRKDGQYGDWSPVSRAYVAVPDAVTSLTTNLESSSGVRLHWEHPASGIPHTYRVQRLQDDGSYADIGVTAAGSRTTRSFLDASGATSAYRVVAVNHAGLRGEHAESATATVTVPETIHVWPDMPRNLTSMMLDPGTVKLTWYAPAEHARDVDAYRIYRKRADDNRGLGASYQRHVLVALTGNANTHHIDHTAQPGVTYEYGVAAYWDGYTRPLGQISNRAYARPWE